MEIARMTRPNAESAKDRDTGKRPANRCGPQRFIVKVRAGVSAPQHPDDSSIVPGSSDLGLRDAQFAERARGGEVTQ